MNVNFVTDSGNQVWLAINEHREEINNLLCDLGVGEISTMLPILTPALNAEARQAGAMSVWWPSSSGYTFWVDELGRLWACDPIPCTRCIVRGIDTSGDTIINPCGAMALVVPE